MAFLHGVEIVEITDGARPIRTVRTGVIGLVGTAPKGPRHTPTLTAGDRTRAVQVFGTRYLYPPPGTWAAPCSGF